MTTSRYSLIKQPNASDATITEFVIKDTTDGSIEAIEQIFLHFNFCEWANVDVVWSK